MTPQETLERALRAEAAQEFIGPAIEALRAEYEGRMRDIAVNEPWEARKISNLALGLKIIDAVEGDIAAAVAGKAIAEPALARARRLESYHPEKRSMLEKLGLV